MMLVAPAEDVNRLRRQSRRWRFKKPLDVVAGGKTRADSVRAGLAAVSKASSYIAVHDAVRPLVTPRIIERVIRAARESKAALAACPSKDTVKLADQNGFVRQSPPRETVWLAQTPQIFERGLLLRAHQKGRHAAVTDDAQLVERLGKRVKLVESPSENIKVTVPMDFIVAERILKNRGSLTQVAAATALSRWERDGSAQGEA
jgi:2-C-methyl-D-erythritol 4-phosphate cytidylyltransferase